MSTGPDLTYAIAVIGAGAAGLMTAITAARRRPGTDLVLLEGARRPGAKILVSGGGRCNVTNAVVRPSDFHGDRRAVARVLDRFGTDDTVSFFRGIGVDLEHEPEFGKLFPRSGRARDVLDALLAEAARLGIALRSGFRVAEVKAAGDGFALADDAGATLGARRLVLATGGRSLPKSGSDGAGYGFARALGHTVTPTAPALVALVLDPHPLADLPGLSFPASIQVVAPSGRGLARVTGPALVTHFGLSGPAVLDVSRHWTAAAEPRPALRLSFLPGREPQGLEREWIAAAARDGGRPVTSLLAGLPARLGRALVALAGLAADVPLARLDRAGRGRLARVATALPLAVSDTRGWREAEVTAGGVPLAEVDLGTMASRRRPGLHLVGEILDVDGRIGGFNFQWAWATGFIAGEALAAGCSARPGTQ